MGRKIELVAGQVFNRLTVVSEIPATKSGRLRWACICVCGTPTEVGAYELVSHHTKSCGCWTFEASKLANTTHGRSYSVEHQAWRDMWQRCTNPNNPYYHIYKDRLPPGEWRDFPTFYRDVGARPSKGLSLDRIDNDKPYGPGNCRWATPKEQSRNRSRTIYAELEGETLSLAEFAARFEVPYDRVYVRFVKLKWPLLRALTEKPRGY